MRSIYAAMIMRQSPDGSNPQPGYDWLKKLDANTSAYAANPADLYLKLSRQQGTLSAWNLQDILLQANQSNMPFGYVMPASGAPVLVDGLAAVKGGNSAGAQKFIEFLFDDTLRADLAKRLLPDPGGGDRPAAGVAGQPRPQADGRQLGRHRRQHETEWINHWNS